ncbi:MAG: histidine phosphatase family protein [Myxococcales bacterium]|nr:histidine phosphatase family protein [Myxococcales bacterium]
MSSLLLLRHGQASLHGPDYDVLSGKGADQSRAVGRRLADLARDGGAAIEVVFVGPQRRHAETLAHLTAVATEAGTSFPEATTIDAFAEIDITPLIRDAERRVYPSCPDLPAQLARGELDDAARQAVVHLQGIIAKLLERWASGEAFDGVEPFADFTGRVRGGLSLVAGQLGSGRRALVVTSSGPISVMVATALGLAPDKTVGLMLSAVNASFTELLVSPGRLSLRSFNDHAHLAPHLVTSI